MFCDRLKEYRLKHRYKMYSKKSFAAYLGIDPSAYSLLESGKRKPNDSIIELLSLKTGLPKWYWKYGINQFELKKLNSIMKKMLNNQILLQERDFNIKELNAIITAFKDDLKNEVKKQQLRDTSNKDIPIK